MIRRMPNANFSTLSSGQETGAARSPSATCAKCPRLAQFRAQQRTQFPHWHNAPVPSFGPEKARLMIVGLAPGLKGANRTGRPFTGDYAGDLLYKMLASYGFSHGCYQAAADDGLRLTDCRITNAVRCVPPQNKPNASEINTCRGFLQAEVGAMPDLRVILVLGRIAHDSCVRALGYRLADFPFEHGRHFSLSNDLILVDSYHCSRYNTNTGRLTEQMFSDVFGGITAHLNG